MNTCYINACRSLTHPDVTILDVGLGIPATNQEIVRDAYERINVILGFGLIGRNVVLINGAISTPVIGMLSLRLSSFTSVIGVFDQQLQGYVIFQSCNPNYDIGDLIHKDSV
jgi:hypothetical protein